MSSFLQSLRDLIDLVFKCSAILLIFWALYQGIPEFRKILQLSEKNLRWKQAKTARELVDQMLKDERSAYAMLMLTKNGREFELKYGKRTHNLMIFIEDILRALENMKNQSQQGQTILDNQQEEIIADCFDGFFLNICLLEQAIQNELIKFDDVKFPINFYLSKYLLNDKTGLDAYGNFTVQLNLEKKPGGKTARQICEGFAEAKGYQLALDFFNRFPSRQRR
jgi:hypothetical protein